MDHSNAAQVNPAKRRKWLDESADSFVGAIVLLAHHRQAYLTARSEESSLWKERDWNKEFQDIMKDAQFLFTEPSFTSAQGAGERAKSFVSLSQLADDFLYASKLYAKVIISELHVPVENKTIKPSKIGGIAGGDKVHRIRCSPSHSVSL